MLMDMMMMMMIGVMVIMSDIVIIIIISILVITFMQGIYNYIPGTNHVSRLYTIMLQLFCIYNLCYM
jgi:hypothetical protein